MYIPFDGLRCDDCFHSFSDYEIVKNKVMLMDGKHLCRECYEDFEEYCENDDRLFCADSHENYIEQNGDRHAREARASVALLDSLIARVAFS